MRLTYTAHSPYNQLQTVLQLYNIISTSTYNMIKYTPLEHCYYLYKIRPVKYSMFYC